MDADYVDQQIHHTNTPAQAEFLQYTLKQAAIIMSFDISSDKIRFIRLRLNGSIPSINKESLKLLG